MLGKCELEINSSWNKPVWHLHLYYNKLDSIDGTDYILGKKLICSQYPSLQFL